MPTSAYLTRSFHFIIEQIIATGQAPGYIELAEELGISAAEGRKVLRKLISSITFPGWLFPKTDKIASFAPFYNAPNNYRLTIEGEQKWFAQ